MREEWKKLMIDTKFSLGILISDKDSEELYQKIEKFYQQNKRHYHTLEHVRDLIYHLNQDFNWYISLREKTLLQFAIFFHDLIYKPGDSYNEEESANQAYILLENIGVPKESLQKIHKMILKTKHNPEDPPKTYIEKILVDLDLKGLGTHEYWRGGELFRKEFSHLTDKEWNLERISFIDNFLNRKNIFHTEIYKMKYEKSARKFLMEEREKLIEKMAQ